jgi:two-component system, cell cycle sensor histidine kinase and response regulator CckA
MHRVARIILVIEDNSAICKLICFVLRREGYKVLAASSSSEALRIGQLHQMEIDLVLSDVVLRSETAAPVVASLRELNPQARVLYLSGYTIEGLYQGGWLKPGTLSDGSTFFLQKPFLPELLIKVVASALDPEASPDAEHWVREEVACRVQRAY